MIRLSALAVKTSNAGKSCTHVLQTQCVLFIFIHAQQRNTVVERERAQALQLSDCVQ